MSSKQTLPVSFRTAAVLSQPVNLRGLFTYGKEIFVWLQESLAGQAALTGFGFVAAQRLFMGIVTDGCERF